MGSAVTSVNKMDIISVFIRISIPTGNSYYQLNHSSVYSGILSSSKGTSWTYEEKAVVFKMSESFLKQ